MHRLEAQPVDVGNGRDQRWPDELAREKRADEVAADLLGGLGLEDQARAVAHGAHAGEVALEAVEQALGLGLVPRVERGADPVGRPGLVDSAILRTWRVG